VAALVSLDPAATGKRQINICHVSYSLLS
jgi:hypothetical protein